MCEWINKIIFIEEKDYNHDSANQDYVPKEDTLSEC